MLPFNEKIRKMIGEIEKVELNGPALFGHFGGSRKDPICMRLWVNIFCEEFDELSKIVREGKRGFD